jgi:hypothetical protein
MIVRESLEFQRGRSSKASLGVGYKNLIDEWIKMVGDTPLVWQDKDKIPVKFKVDPETLEIKATFAANFINKWNRWPDYIIDNLDPKSLYTLSNKTHQHSDLMKMSMDAGFVPSPSAIKTNYWRIERGAGKEALKNVMIKGLPKKLPNDMAQLALTLFSNEEFEKYFDNPEFLENREDLKDRPKQERRNDYNEASNLLTNAGFIIETTDRQFKNETIAFYPGRKYNKARSFTITKGGRIRMQYNTSNLFADNKATYVEMAEFIINRNKKYLR